MRHVVGFFLGLALIPVLALGPAWAFELTSLATRPETTGTRLLPSFLVMALIGVVLGVTLAARRLSALALLVPGLALLALTVVAVVDAGLVLDRLPDTTLGASIWSFVVHGVDALLGAALLVAAPRRARSSRARAAVPPGSLTASRY
jgi:hypothetical protein